MVPPPSVPPPSGIPRPMMGAGGAAALDPNNPLAAVAQPFKQQAAAHAAIPQPQRIEVDEGAVQVARSGASKQMHRGRAPPRSRRRRHRVGRRRRLAAGGRSREEHARRARARGRSAQGQDDRRSDQGQGHEWRQEPHRRAQVPGRPGEEPVGSSTSTSRATSCSAAASPASRRTPRRASSSSSTACRR